MSTKNKRRPSSTGGDFRDSKLSTPSIFASLSTLLFSDKFSDMVIRCGGREFKAHRAIVCPQCPFFDRAFSGNFKEAVSQEIDLPEDDAEIFHHFLEYLYTGSYDDGVSPTQLGQSMIATLSLEDVQHRLGTDPGPSWEATLVNRRKVTARGGFAAMRFAKSLDDEPDESDDSNWETGSSSSSSEESDAPALDEDAGADGGLEEFTAVREGTFVSLRSDGVENLPVARKDILVALRLYIMADKYDVPGLQLLARERFYRAAELVCDTEFFADVVGELYSYTREQGNALREISCRLVGNCIDNCDVRARMASVMAEHGEFAVGVMEYMIHFRKEAW